MTFGLLLAAVAAAGYTLTSGSLLSKVFCLEVALLGVAVTLVASSVGESASVAYSLALLSVCVAGAETAIGLSLIVALGEGPEADLH
jgi:NADH:ubiquinone oxidoreductase subunit K